MLKMEDNVEYYKFYVVPRCLSQCHANYGLRLDFYGYVMNKNGKDKQLQTNVATIYPFVVG